jgi:hypothetical protein
LEFDLLVKKIRPGPQLSKMVSAGLFCFIYVFLVARFIWREGWVGTMPPLFISSPELKA